MTSAVSRAVREQLSIHTHTPAAVAGPAAAARSDGSDIKHRGGGFLCAVPTRAGRCAGNGGFIPTSDGLNVDVREN